jgi:hypothetical protein
MFVLTAACGASSGTADEGETAICRRAILVFPAAAAPVQPDTVIANFSVLCTVDAYGMLFAALHLTRLAWPAASTASGFWFDAGVPFAARHL